MAESFLDAGEGHLQTVCEGRESREAGRGEESGQRICGERARAGVREQESQKEGLEERKGRLAARARVQLVSGRVLWQRTLAPLAGPTICPHSW